MEEQLPSFETELKALLKQEKAKTKRSLTKFSLVKRRSFRKIDSQSLTSPHSMLRRSPGHSPIPRRLKSKRSDYKGSKSIVSSKNSTRDVSEKFVTTFVRKVAGPTEPYIDMMVTPYADPLTIDDIELMRFTPERERRDQQPGGWGKLAAVLLNPQSKHRWKRIITNLKNFKRKETGWYIPKSEKQEIKQIQRLMNIKASRQYTRLETNASGSSIEDLIALKKKSKEISLQLGSNPDNVFKSLSNQMVIKQNRDTLVKQKRSQSEDISATEEQEEAKGEIVKIPKKEKKRKGSVTFFSKEKLLQNVEEVGYENQNSGNSANLKQVIDYLNRTESYGLQAEEQDGRRRSQTSVRRDVRPSHQKQHIHKRNVGDLIVPHQRYEVPASEAIPEEPASPKSPQSQAKPIYQTPHYESESFFASEWTGQATTMLNSPSESPKAKLEIKPRLTRDKIVKFLMSDKFGEFIHTRKTINHSAIAKELESFDLQPETKIRPRNLKVKQFLEKKPETKLPQLLIRPKQTPHTANIFKLIDKNLGAEEVTRPGSILTDSRSKLLRRPKSRGQVKSLGNYEQLVGLSRGTPLSGNFGEKKQSQTFYSTQSKLSYAAQQFMTTASFQNQEILENLEKQLASKTLFK